jgi:hypothetical protein
MRPPKQAGASSIHLMVVRFTNWGPGDKNNIPTRLKLFHPQANGFAQTPLDPIPNDCAANPATYRKAKTAIR